jgi:FAD/FMN-containing dehydrogenase
MSTAPVSRATIASGLRRAVAGDVRFGLHDRMLYATDASIYQVEPLGVVIPNSVDDAVRAVEFCRDRGLPVLPRGGGTSLAGQCTAEAVVLDLSARCRELVRLDTGARTCEAEAGLTVEDLNDLLRESGLHFAPDPSTARHATIAGCIGNNAAGSHSVLYGRTASRCSGSICASPTGARSRSMRVPPCATRSRRT